MCVLISFQHHDKLIYIVDTIIAAVRVILCSEENKKISRNENVGFIRLYSIKKL